ncbi:YbbR-like domain-containing protein [Aquibacillus albus]|uniref:YbbR domain-containing protein n=1 Tax=Aquibacillus albus TaxID=1168171 RepID=A0ABS2N5A4_9BACI|nr:CdaR family protein [Aquibacillus albus]MBM7573288.1 YbbR domain-containing protein [Aquibacillus albus]
MDEWLKNPWVIRALSLVLALLLFSAVSLDDDNYQSDAALDFLSSSEEAQRIEDVPLNIKINEDKYVVSGVPKTVTVTLEGPNSVVTSTATQQSFDMFLDLEDLESGTYTVPVQYTGISDSLSVYIEPKEVEVTIEERATEVFDVTVDYINENLIEPGFEIGDAQVNPGQVTITSSRSVVEKIAIVKAFVDVRGVDMPIEEQESPVKVYDAQGNELNVRVEPVIVDVSVSISNPSKNLPIEVVTTGETQEGISIRSLAVEPEEVRVFASEEVLTNLDSISTKAIDLSTISQGESREVELDIPTNLRLIDRESVTVIIEVDRTTERTFEDVPIEPRNINDGLEVTFINPVNGVADVIVTGPERIIDDLPETDIQPFIDIDERQEGQYDLTIQIEELDDITAVPELARATVQID